MYGISQCQSETQNSKSAKNKGNFLDKAEHSTGAMYQVSINLDTLSCCFSVQVESSGALLVRRKLLKELTGSNMWKAGFFSKQICLGDSFPPSTKKPSH